VSTLLEAASRAQDVSPQIGNELLDRARSEVRATVDEARLAIWNLRHSTESDGDAASALAQLTQRISLESGLAIGFESAGVPVPLSAESEHSLLMLVREALQNAIRHAAPKNLSVRLRFERRRLSVEIEDDGRGFDCSAGLPADGHHYGLIGMRERIEKLGGEFQLRSSPGQGTCVRLSIAVGDARRDDRLG
jgi:signal transduction histidine kinase